MKTEHGWMIAIGVLVGAVLLYNPSPQKAPKPKPVDPEVEEVEAVELSKNGKLARKTADNLLKSYIDVFKTLKSEGIEEGEEFTKRMSELTSEMFVEVFDPLDEAAKSLEENYTTSKGKKFCNDMIAGFQDARKVNPVSIGDRKRRPFREGCQCGEGYECSCAEGKCICENCKCPNCKGN